MVDLRAVIDNLVSIGFYDVFLPFLLVYAVIFAILQKSKIFEGGSSSSEQARNINALVAFVFGLFVVASIHIVTIFQHLIVNVAVIIVFILTLLIVLGFIFGDSYTELFKDPKIKSSIGILVFLTVLVILFNVLGWWESIRRWWISNDVTSWIWSILGILVFAGILYVISREPSKSKEK
jgi:magnesium-transporting ATPase (P-type)